MFFLNLELLFAVICLIWLCWPPVNESFNLYLLLVRFLSNVNIIGLYDWFDTLATLSDKLTNQRPPCESCYSTETFQCTRIYRWRLEGLKCNNYFWKSWLLNSLNVLVDQWLLMAIFSWVFITFLAMRAQTYAWFYETKPHIAERFRDKIMAFTWSWVELCVKLWVVCDS